MKIRFNCSCGQKLAAPSGHAGKKGRCPRCGAQMTIPAPPEDGPPIRIDKADLKATEAGVPSESLTAAPSRPSETKVTAVTGVPRRKTMKANRRIAGKVCAICQDKIRFGEEICICNYCELPFHVPCWEENGGCGTYGCEASPDAAGRQREPDFSVSEEQVSES